MVIKTENIKIDSKLLESIRQIAKDENIPENKVLNEVIEKGIENRTKNKIPEHLILNKNRKPDPKKHMEMAGIIKAPPGFDVAKAIEDVRTRNY